MTLRDRLARRAAAFLFGDTIEQMVRTETAERLGAVSVRVDDSPGWESLAGQGPHDQPWAERYTDLEETLEAWRKNFYIRRLVTLTRSYVVAGGFRISTDNPEVKPFLHAFWHHRQNKMDQRMGPICDELTRAGEIFAILFTNQVDGMSYVRFVPASRIQQIETDEDDYEVELRYAQTRELTAEPKWWIGHGHAHAFKTHYNKLKPLMLHFCVNRPVGATRGESDLLPVLPWAKRYSEWLKDRVRLNRIRTRQAIMHLKISDPALVEQKRQQIRTDNPVEKGIYVSGPDEEIVIGRLGIESGDAEDDGRALRLAMVCGGNVGLHYMGEGEAVNYATAKEMGEPTTRFYADRQVELAAALKDLVAAAYHRYCVITGRAWPGRESLELYHSALEVARADSESLAKATRDIVQAFSVMRSNGWIDDQTAVRLALKFAGEPLGEEQVLAMLAQAAPPHDPSRPREGTQKEESE